MKVLIESNDNGSGTDSTLLVYKIYNTSQNLTDNFPLCKIEEDDFFELFNNPEKEFEKAVSGKIYFYVPESKLLEKAKHIF